MSVFEVDFKVIAQVVAAPVARLGTATAGAEEIPKNIRKDVLETLREVESAKAATAGLRALERGMAEAIILGAFLRVREDLVSLVALLELLFGLAVAGIPIGMMLNSQAAVGFFDLVVIRAARNAEQFVIIAFAVVSHPELDLTLVCGPTVGGRASRRKVRRRFYKSYPSVPPPVQSTDSDKPGS